MTAPDTAAETGLPVAAPPAERDPSLVLAGLHLRLGSLALARAELETLAAQGGLDRDARVDLAEVRWRTGDLLGAGEAARESLAAGDESVVSLVVAAEAAAALGRPTESRRLATQAQARMGGPIDPIFAGMPRSGVWPADPAEPVPSPTTLFPPERHAGGNGLAAERAAAADRVAAGDRAEAAARASHDPAPFGRDGEAAHGEALAATGAAMTPAGPASSDHLGPGFWDDLPGDEAPTTAAPTPDLAIPREPGPPAGLDPGTILDAGEAALAAGDYASAALHLGLVVRVAPSIAPAVLAAIGDTPDAGLQMVRGDAYRVLGRELDARRAYELAMSSAGAPPPSSGVDPSHPGGSPGDPSWPVASIWPVGLAGPAAPADASGEAEPPPFLKARPWSRRLDPPVPDPPSDPDDDSDPFAGEP